LNPNNHTLTVERSLPNERLDRFLCGHFPHASRGTIQRLIKEGQPTHAPRAGERIDVEFPPPKDPIPQPADIPLDVLFEDADLLVLNKAAGMVVHPAAGTEDDTLVNALLHHCRGQLSGIGGVARPGIVHRLDKETSGVMVVAKNDTAHLALSKQFAGRSVEKVYRAIVCGEVQAARGEIDVAIARHPSHRKRMATTKGRGRSARTSYEVIERLNHATLVQAYLHTGRTHQVRVHFQHLGHPLVGDPTYGKKQLARLAELTGVTAPRVMLHAWRLAFLHPKDDRPLTFEVPPAGDFVAVHESLRCRTL
jgi:23S rRNA pseudouridine1911/1915/1917 synthase